MNAALPATRESSALDTNISPCDRATQFHKLIKQIEAAMAESEGNVAEIEQRNPLKHLISSSRADLVTLAKSQNRVDQLLVKLHQETITLNTMGYAYLASVIAEFERQVNEGSRDSDGKIHVLASNGKKVARMATEMFNAILDTSQSTQESIDANTAAVLNHEGRLDELAREISQQSNRAASFEKWQSMVESRLDSLAADALRNAELLAASKTVLDALAQQQSEVIDGFKAHERERAALYVKASALQGDLSKATEREDALRRQLQRTVRTLWSAFVAVSGLCIATGARVFGWL